MTRRTILLAASLLIPTLVGLTSQGCSSKSGRSVPVGSPQANLQVTNNSVRTVDVYVDRVLLGAVQPGQVRSWDILNGVRPVHMRERGESTLTYYGDFNFFNGNLVGLTYEPGLTHNFTVINDNVRTLHVFVDLWEVGQVPPLEQRDFLITPGIHDVHFRESGQSGLDFVGTFDFPALSNGQEIVLVYRP